MINDFLLQYIIAFGALILVLSVVLIGCLAKVMRAYLKGQKLFAGPVALIVIVFSGVALGAVGYNLFKDYQSEEVMDLYIKGFAFLPAVIFVMLFIIKILKLFMWGQSITEDKDVKTDQRPY